MSVRLKDIFRNFAPDRPADGPETAATDGPAALDGATALVLAEFLDAVDALSALLEEETGCVAAGALDRLEVFAQRKNALAERLEGVLAQARTEGVTLGAGLDDGFRALALERIERLDRAVGRNTGGLVALRKAVLTINRNLLSALETAASDGLYASSGQAVRPVELSASGLNATL